MHAFERAVEEAYAQQSTCSSGASGQASAVAGSSPCPTGKSGQQDPMNVSAISVGKGTSTCQDPTELLPTEIIEKIYAHVLDEASALPAQQQQKQPRRRTTTKTLLHTHSSAAAPSYPDSAVCRSASMDLRTGLRDVARVSCANRCECARVRLSVPFKH